MPTAHLCSLASQTPAPVQSLQVECACEQLLHPATAAVQRLLLLLTAAFGPTLCSGLADQSLQVGLACVARLSPAEMFEQVLPADVVSVLPLRPAVMVE